MHLRRRLWRWSLAALLLAAFFVWGTWSIFGEFYLGYPPYTPAFLNNTERPIERDLALGRASRLRVFGEITQGQVTVSIDGVRRRTLIGLTEASFVLPAGRHRLVLENASSYGRIDYALQ